MAKRRCKGKTKNGTRCKAAPLTDHAFCLAHSDEKTRDNTGFGGHQEGAGRPRKPKLSDILLAKVEENADRVLDPLFDALEASRSVVVGSGEFAEIEEVPDHRVRIKAVALIFDRIEGRPLVQVAVGNTRPDQPLRISHELLTDPSLRDDLRGLKRKLAGAGAERSVGARSGDKPPT